MMAGKNVFVTVGTTKFDELIKTISSDEVLNRLLKLGYTSLTIQIGNGCFEPSVEYNTGLKMNYYRLKASIVEDIRNASLVISHAGAGSCLEILREHKPLIAVINETLMGNHQQEIAEALANENYLKYCTCRSLEQCLTEREYETLDVYPEGNSKLFANYLDQCMGVTNK